MTTKRLNIKIISIVWISINTPFYTRVVSYVWIWSRFKCRSASHCRKTLKAFYCFTVRLLATMTISPFENSP